MGSRDLSVISTAPPNRQPIQTESHVFSEEIVRDAVRAELARGGQVYFVHNRVEELQSLQGMLARLCPEARVGVGHGKMPAEQLEKLIMDFIYGEFDVLVSTTIVENGIDIPNANTIIVDNAQNFGLSDLHQLRGRVGRGAAESWCFLVSDNQSENVQKRLKFLCSTTDGFAVAQYDLETRGPGDFFGSRQHGLPTLQIADLMNDTRTLHAAQAEAVAMLADDPLLEAPEHSLLAAQVEQMFTKAGAMN